MKINFAALSDEDRKAQFAKMSNDELAASLAEARTETSAAFAIDGPTIAQVNEAEAVFTSMKHIEAEQATREAAATEAGERFAAAKAEFSAKEDEDKKDEDKPEFSADEDEGDESEDGDDEGDESEDGDDEGDESEDGEDGTEGEGDAVVTAAGVNHTTSQRAKVSAARRVGRKGRRPAAPDTKAAVITAAADVPGFSMGSQMGGMADVAKALQGRIKNFAPFNKRNAEAVHSQSNGEPVLNKAAVASFGVEFGGKAAALTASSGAAGEYDAVKEIVAEHTERVNASVSGDHVTMTAAMAWCAPSEVVYNWIADYVVDGLMTMPEIPAPRGGLWMTEGPQLAQGTYADPEDFGFGGTEAEMEAGYVKTCETIECPEFVDHRLDFDGYCWKIPILTEKAFPELVADAMRLTDVLYAHRMNARYIRDVIAESTGITAGDIYGGSVNDTLEALVQVAVKERRWWNIGENAVMEVKLPQHAREIFKFDMARRSGLALNDVATDQKIAAYFANHNLSVEYISDFDSLHGAVTPTAAWPDAIRAIMYPVGTFVRAAEDVINLSAVYDAASLSQNEYTGVFFEQGVKVIKRGYRSHVLTIPVCTAGATGANIFTCDNFGSF